jgi:oligopeptidase A
MSLCFSLLDDETMTEELGNPLLQPATKLPAFDRIRPDHVVPGVSALVNEVEGMLEELEGSCEHAEPTWEGLVDRLERMQERIGFAFGIVDHLMGVRNSPPLREAYDAVEPDVVKLLTRIGQSQPIYRGLIALRAHQNDQEKKMSRRERRILDKLVQEAELSGVGLEGPSRERFQQIRLEVAELATRFGNQLLDATKAFALELTRPEEVEGLPASFLEMAAQAAREAGAAAATPEKGPWKVNLDGPSYVGFLKHAKRRDLREALYRAQVQRASREPQDNTLLIDQILRLRLEEAKLLGFQTYAELSLSRKMAGTVGRAETLLEELLAASHGAGVRELEELRAFMAERGAAEESRDLRHWDLPYWSERLREERFDYSEEQIRKYFPLPRVLDGLFALAKRLFGVEVTPADGETPVWHPDVRFFRVRSLEGEEVAAFYLDPYSRPSEKKGGAWMNELVGRSRLFQVPGKGPRLPVAYLICNGSPPVEGNPSLMTFREIETLFHEFGHALQHMLTRVDLGLASGIRNVEWDAVELPSQFMENWCYQRETLVGLSEHVDTKEPLPEELFERIRSSRTFQAGLATLRQLYFGFLDLELHHRFTPGASESPFDVQRRVAARTLLIPPIPEDRFLCGFSHIFQGGYAAGYYSYKWAEVLSADAFAAFEEAGLERSDAVAETGRRFRETVLALGGSESPMEVFQKFRGREPTTAALLRHNGLASVAG